MTEKVLNLVQQVRSKSTEKELVRSFVRFRIISEKLVRSIMLFRIIRLKHFLRVRFASDSFLHT